MGFHVVVQSLRVRGGDHTAGVDANIKSTVMIANEGVSKKNKKKTYARSAVRQPCMTHGLACRQGVGLFPSPSKPIFKGESCIRSDIASVWKALIG